eukprot:1161745-Pelagomonas_calceolata.AAC.14
MPSQHGGVPHYAQSQEFMDAVAAREGMPGDCQEDPLQQSVFPSLAIARGSLGAVAALATVPFNEGLKDIFTNTQQQSAQSPSVPPCIFAPCTSPWGWEFQTP